MTATRAAKAVLLLHSLAFIVMSVVSAEELESCVRNQTLTVCIEPEPTQNFAQQIASGVVLLLALACTIIMVFAMRANRREDSAVTSSKDAQRFFLEKKVQFSFAGEQEKVGERTAMGLFTDGEIEKEYLVQRFLHKRELIHEHLVRGMLFIMFVCIGSFIFLILFNGRKEHYYG